MRQRWCTFCGYMQAHHPDHPSAKPAKEDHCPRCGEIEWRDLETQPPRPPMREVVA